MEDRTQNYDPEVHRQCFSPLFSFSFSFSFSLVDENVWILVFVFVSKSNFSRSARLVEKKWGILGRRRSHYDEN